MELEVNITSKIKCLYSESVWETRWPNGYIVGLRIKPGSLCSVFGQDTNSLTHTLTVPLSTQEYKWVLANC